VKRISLRPGDRGCCLLSHLLSRLASTAKLKKEVDEEPLARSPTLGLYSIFCGINLAATNRMRAYPLRRIRSSMDKSPPFDNSDYSVVVKNRAPLPNSWRWEIYRAGRASPMGRSPIFFCTVTEAHRAGKVALKQLMAKSFPKRIPILRMDLS
jgi:hypothetical protein